MSPSLSPTVPEPVLSLFAAGVLPDYDQPLKDSGAVIEADAAFAQRLRMIGLIPLKLHCEMIRLKRTSDKSGKAVPRLPPRVARYRSFQAALPKLVARNEIEIVHLSSFRRQIYRENQCFRLDQQVAFVLRPTIRGTSVSVAMSGEIGRGVELRA